MVIIMKNRYKISLLVIAILLAFSMTVGTSYAFWTTTVTQTKQNEVAAGCLEIELNDVELDESGNSISTSINLTNAYPMSDTKGLTTKPYSLTIKNTCSINANYTILLNTLSTSALTENHMKYHMIKTSPAETNMTPVLISSITPTILDSAIKTDIGTAVGGEVQNSYIIGNGTLNAEAENVTDSVTYNLRLWIDESVDNEVMENTFEAAVAVYAEATK